MALLLSHFAAIAEATHFRLSFGVVRSAQCPKFHVDHNRLRLITTYSGPGTEWVPNEAVRRECMDQREDWPSNANELIVPNAAAVQRTQAGDVLLMKGSRGNGTLGAVHRSPSSAGRFGRVVLVASTVADS